MRKITANIIEQRKTGDTEGVTPTRKPVLSLSDYTNARALHERPKEHVLEPGEMSLGQYRRWRGV
jgi:hypothetical protein